jgi:hypothetical protein
MIFKLNILINVGILSLYSIFRINDFSVGGDLHLGVQHHGSLQDRRLPRPARGRRQLEPIRQRRNRNDLSKVKEFEILLKSMSQT